MSAEATSDHLDAEPLQHSSGGGGLVRRYQQYKAELANLTPDASAHDKVSLEDSISLVLNRMIELGISPLVIETENVTTNTVAEEVLSPEEASRRKSALETLGKKALVSFGRVRKIRTEKTPGQYDHNETLLIKDDVDALLDRALAEGLVVGSGELEEKDYMPSFPLKEAPINATLSGLREAVRRDTLAKLTVGNPEDRTIRDAFVLDRRQNGETHVRLVRDESDPQMPFQVEVDDVAANRYHTIRVGTDKTAAEAVFRAPFQHYSKDSELAIPREQDA